MSTSSFSSSRSLRAGYQAMLCSPRFLESPGPLDDHALASRLSYFLWSSMPDDTLRALADAGKLRNAKVLNEQFERLLNDPKALLTSNLGNASSHDNKNLPVLFGGGKFEHGQHLAFNRKDNYPLPNLYLSALKSLGIEQESFATSTGEMKGLERKA